MRTSLHLVRLSVLIFFLSLFSIHTSAQSISSANGKLELGIGLGPMFFLGDLGGSAGVGKTFIKDLDLPLTKLSKSAYLNFYPTEWVGLRISGTMGFVEGNDAEAPAKGADEEARKYRNLSFQSKINEAYAALEFYPTVFFEKYDGLQGKLRPYVLGGAGIYHFNPKAKDNNGNLVALAPLKLEGQGFAEYPESKPYKLTQKNLMIGFGFKYYLKENMYIGLEILHRKLFTDYVDDVSHNYYIDPIHFDSYLSPADAVTARSLYYRGIYTFPTTRPYQEFAQRGDPKQNDAYFSSMLRFGWRLGKSDARLKQLKCPVFY